MLKFNPGLALTGLRTTRPSLATKQFVDCYILHFRDRRGAARLRSVSEIAPKSPFLCVNGGPIRDIFGAGAKAFR